MQEQREAAYPSVMHHKHGLYDWAPMMPERSGETIVPGEPPAKRVYRCQEIGCDAMVKVEAREIRDVA